MIQECNLSHLKAKSNTIGYPPPLWHPPFFILSILRIVFTVKFAKKVFLFKVFEKKKKIFVISVYKLPVRSN